MKKIAWGIAVIGLSAVLAACGKKSASLSNAHQASSVDAAPEAAASGIVGKWQGNWNNMELVYEFRPDGLLHVVNSGVSMHGTYEISGDKVILLLSGSRQTGKFKINGDTMVLTANGIDINLNRAS